MTSTVNVTLYLPDGPKKIKRMKCYAKLSALEDWCRSHRLILIEALAQPHRDNPGGEHCML